jgi:hypothetical protein
MSEAVGPGAAGYEIRPMSMAETLDAGFQVLKNNIALLGVLSLVGQAPTILVFMLFGWMLDPFAFQDGELPDIGAAFLLGVALWILALLVLLPVVIGAITAAVSDLYLGGEVSVAGALRRGFARMFPLMVTYVIFSLILGVAMGLLVFFGVLVFGGFASVLEGSGIAIALLILVGLVAIPAAFCLAGVLTVTPGVLAAVVVLEGLSLFEAVARTGSLVAAALWRFTGIGLVLYTLVLILPTGIQFMVGSVPVLGAIVWGVVQALCQAYVYATTVVAYFDVRCRTESFDLEHLAQLVEAAGPSTAASGPLPL